MSIKIVTDSTCDLPEDYEAYKAHTSVLIPRPPSNPN